MLRVLNQAYEQPLQQEEHASANFAGGILQHGYQCGMIWGAALAAGAQAYRRYGASPKAEAGAILAAQKLVESFRAHTGEINCYEITELDRSSSAMQMIVYFLIKGGTIGCFKLAAKYAPAAFDEINSVFSAEIEDPPHPPISCASILAGKMGASDLHTTMAAGLAGGIGLCGGACGALGAAIWIQSIRKENAGKNKIDFSSPESLAIIEKFLKCSKYEFECAAIVGRKFRNIEDHAGYLHNGGCSEIIETLAAV